MDINLPLEILINLLIIYIFDIIIGIVSAIVGGDFNVGLLVIYFMLYLVLQLELVLLLLLSSLFRISILVGSNFFNIILFGKDKLNSAEKSKIFQRLHLKLIYYYSNNMNYMMLIIKEI
jgi:hypothetical protein